MTRQRLWQLRKLEEGRCSQCSKPRNLYADKCDKCQMERNEKRRKQVGAERRNLTYLTGRQSRLD